MKKQLFIILFSAISITGFAQFPFNGFNYQGIARDANGKGFDAQNIGVKFELFNHATGISVYNETLNTTTNKFGLFTHVLGGQAQLQFAGLPWASGIDLEVSIDTAGGVSYVAIGPKTQFEGVPYSLFSYASFLDWSRSGNAAGVNDFLGTTNLFPLIFKTNSNEAMRVDINQNVGIGNNPVSKLDVNGDIHATDSIMSNSKISSGTYVNTVNGYKYKNSAVTGKYLRGNGSHFVPDSIKLADLPAAIASPPWTKSGNNIFPTVLNNKVGINNNLPVEQLDVIGGANTTLGYKYNSVATAGKYLRGNGSYIILDSIKLTDLPAGVASIPWTKSGTNVFPTSINDNIGIGVNTPISPLQVYSASNNDTILARFIGTNSFGAAIQIANALNTTTAIIFKSASTQASIGYNPIGPNRLFIENIKIGGNIHITTNDRLRIKTDTVSINGTNTSQAFFGVGVNNPSAGIHLLSDNGALFQGQHALGAAKNLGAGTRMMWYSKKSAFRAGAVTGTQWDDTNIGNYSFAVGKDNTARGDSSIAMGQGSVTNGMSSIAIGYTNTLASGAYSFAIGYTAKAVGNGSVAIGALVSANSANSMAIGNGSSTLAASSVAFGTGATIGPNAVNGLAIGNNVLASGVQSFVFGAGTNNGPLTNPINNSIGFGINSDIPTLFVGTSAGIGTTGKVGIGTSAPDQQLTISHLTEPIVRLDRIGAGFDWEIHAASNGFQIRGGANGFGNVLTDFITLDGFGKFGIGTTTPAYKLDVVGGDVQVDVDAKIGSRLASPGSNGYIIPYDVNGRTLIWNTYTASQGILFGTNNIERMRINLAGNVGIGTITPTTKLEVDGTINISGGNANELNRTQTTDANLVPIAYGNINSSGIKNNAGTTSNVASVTRVSAGTYDITITGESITQTDYVAILTSSGGTFGFLTWVGGGSSLGVRTSNNLGVATDMGFVFVLYKK